MIVDVKNQIQNVILTVEGSTYISVIEHEPIQIATVLDTDYLPASEFYLDNGEHPQVDGIHIGYWEESFRIDVAPNEAITHRPTGQKFFIVNNPEVWGNYPRRP